MQKNKLSQRSAHFLRFVFGGTALLAFLFFVMFLVRIRVNTEISLQKWDELIQSKTVSQPVVSETCSPAKPAEAPASASPESFTQERREYSILPEYQALYTRNPDLVGWLKIDGTHINYPVMQTPEDEDYYLKRGFDHEHDENGCLIMDTDSVVGYGTAEYAYEDGIEPSTNLIIHGHTMPSGRMFGSLESYAFQQYGEEHRIIQFDSLYEHRSYELISAFYSRVYHTNETAFKYYTFFQADTQEEFDDWYSNIKQLSRYDTGITAEFGDSFITLSCCSTHRALHGRFVVVGKRIYE